MLSVCRRPAFVASTLVGIAALLCSAGPAFAATKGLMVSCTQASALHWDCLFPIIAATEAANIHYTTVQCSSTGATAYNMLAYDLVVVPPNGGSVAYQVSGNRGSVAGVVNAGSNVNIHVKANTAPTGTVDLNTSPGGTTKCTASISVAF